MSPKAAIIMLLVAIASIVAAFVLFKTTPTYEEQGRAARDVFDFKVSDVNRVVFKRGGDVIYDIRHEKMAWLFNSPPLGRADEAKMLRAISDLRFEARVKEDVTSTDNTASLERFGFGAIRLEVDLYTPGRNYVFEIGGMNPTNDGLYIRKLPGGRVILTATKVRELFDVTADYFLATAADAAGPK